MSEQCAKEWEQRLDNLHLEARGMLRTIVVLHEDLPGMIRLALGGDPEAVVCLNALRDTQEKVRSAPRWQRILCALCPRSLRPREYAFCLSLPYGMDDPTNGLAFGICTKCGPDREQAEAAAFRALRIVWPESRKVDISPTVGHA
jgi:hypothetical protein